jgi:hypothetical protein
MVIEIWWFIIKESEWLDKDKIKIEAIECNYLYYKGNNWEVIKIEIIAKDIIWKEDKIIIRREKENKKWNK